MKVSVQYRGQLATVMGVASEDMDLPQGSTISSFVQDIATRADNGFGSLLVDDIGLPRRTLLVVVDGMQAVDYEEALSEDVREIVLMPPIAGG